MGMDSGKRFIARVVHKEYFSVHGATDIEKEPERFGYVRSLGNDVYAFLAERVELGGATALRNVHSERLDELGLSVGVAWQQAYGAIAAMVAGSTFQQSVTKTGNGNDWAVWIGEDFTSSCPIVPEF